jgi:hypothetical protein
MKWQKASDERKALIDTAMQGVEADKRQMFGYPCWFINGNMFSGLFQDSVFARLSPELIASLGPRYGELRQLEPMPGRPMKGYTVLPEALVSDGGKLTEVLRDAARAARALPPKAAKPAKKQAQAKKPAPADKARPAKKKAR